MAHEGKTMATRPLFVKVEDRGAQEHAPASDSATR